MCESALSQSLITCHSPIIQRVTRRRLMSGDIIRTSAIMRRLHPWKMQHIWPLSSRIIQADNVFPHNAADSFCQHLSTAADRPRQQMHARPIAPDPASSPPQLLAPHACFGRLPRLVKLKQESLKTSGKPAVVTSQPLLFFTPSKTSAKV